MLDLMPALIYPSGWHWQFPNPDEGDLVLFTSDATFQQVVHAVLAVREPDQWWDWTHLWWIYLGDGNRVPCEYFLNDSEAIAEAAYNGHDLIDPETPLVTLGRKRRLDLVWDMGNSAHYTIMFGKRQRPFTGQSGVAAPFADPDWMDRFHMLERDVAGSVP